MLPIPSRRVLLRTGAPLVGSLLAGCTDGLLEGSSEPTQVDDVMLCDVTRERRRGTIEITRKNPPRTVLSESFSFQRRTASGGTVMPTCRSYSEPIDSSGVHRIEVAFDSGRSATRVWNVPGEGTQNEKHGLEVYLEADGVRLREVSLPAP